MKVVVTCVKEASVRVNNEEVSHINHGLLLLVGFTNGDTIDNIKYMTRKISNLRIFSDQNNVMNLSIKDIKGEVLSVSQFTLYADCKKGNRPSYGNALNHNDAEELYSIFNEELKKEIPVKTGIFRENMEVFSINDGPTTIILEK